MIKVMFVCYGNICRSPMAEFLMKDYVKKMGKEKDFYIESSATSYEEIGNPIYPPERKLLTDAGINCENKRAKKLLFEHYSEFDYFIGMDENNRYTMKKFFKGDLDNKVSLILDYSNSPREVSDPWYTGNHKLAFDDILEGVKAFYKYLLDNGKII